MFRYFYEPFGMYLSFSNLSDVSHFGNSPMGTECMYFKFSENGPRCPTKVICGVPVEKIGLVIRAELSRGEMVLGRDDPEI